MNSKVFGTINANSWNPAGHQFDELSGITSNKVMTSVDVCNICKTGESLLSEGSSVTVQDGCRCSKAEAPKVENTGGVIDVSSLATDGSINDEQEDEQETKSDYVENEEKEPEVATTATGQTYIGDNDTVLHKEEEPPIIEQPAQETETPITETSEVEIIGKDDGALEKFCAGEMTTIEYAVNITIIVLFIAISVIAILILFKLAYRSCKNCGSKCKLCKKCGKCKYCCNCQKEVPAPMGTMEGGSVYGDGDDDSYNACDTCNNENISGSGYDNDYDACNAYDAYNNESISGGNICALTGSIF